MIDHKRSPSNSTKIYYSLKDIDRNNYCYYYYIERNEKKSEKID